MSDDFTRSGWTIGGGVEQMFAPRWTARAKVLYADFETQRVTSNTIRVDLTELQHSVTQVRGAPIAKW